MIERYLSTFQCFHVFPLYKAAWLFQSALASQTYTFQWQRRVSPALICSKFRLRSSILILSKPSNLWRFRLKSNERKSNSARLGRKAKTVVNSFKVNTEALATSTNRAIFISNKTSHSLCITKKKTYTLRLFKEKQWNNPFSKWCIDKCDWGWWKLFYCTGVLSTNDVRSALRLEPELPAFCWWSWPRETGKGCVGSLYLRTGLI